jgi:hypothetical protein
MRMSLPTAVPGTPVPARDGAHDGENEQEPEEIQARTEQVTAAAEQEDEDDQNDE